VLAVMIEYTRLSRFLSQLEVGRTGAAFIFDGKGDLVATPDSQADELQHTRSVQPLLPLAKAALVRAGDNGRITAWRDRLTSGGAAYEVALTPLPFPGWSLATVIPESEFLGPVEAALRRLIAGLAVGALLAAIGSAFLARGLIATPLSRVVGEIRHVESFALEQVRRHPSHLKEIASLSGAIAEMASGLSAFSRFIPADLVRLLVQQGVEAKPGGTVRELTVMFIDIVGFTGLSERMGDRIVPLLSRYLDTMSENIVAHGGTIDKFIGDAVMAFWGAPTSQPDHAVRCCRAALACRAAIEASGLADDQGNPLQIRIGINSGSMLIGNIGSELRLNYTVIGDAVNVASRLESANKIFGTSLLIGEATERLAHGALVTREIDSIAVYGREEGLSVHELIGMAGAMRAEEHAQSWIESYQRGLARYRARDFAGAMRDFSLVLDLRLGDRPAKAMLERCERLLQLDATENWSSVAILRSK